MRGWSVRLPLYAAGLAAGGAFSALFGGAGLVYVLGAALVAILVGSAGAYRYLLVFPAAAIYVLAAVYGRLPLTLGGWRALLDQIGLDVFEAAGILYVNPVPYEPHPGLFVVVVPVIVVVVAFATSATLYEESPVVSVAVLGLTVGVISTVSFEVGAGLFFALFLVSGVALLLLSSDGARRGEGLRPAAVAAGALVAGLVLVLPESPVAREATPSALVDWTRIGTGGASRLAVEADVGDYLTTGRDAELLRVRSQEPLLWRGGTLDHFDGVRWSSTTQPGEDDGEEVSTGVPVRNVVQSVEVLEAETNLVFGGYRIQSVSLQNAQERSDSSWASPRPFVEGSSYKLLSQIPQPTTAQLELSGTEYPAGVQERFLQLPEDRPEVLGETAQEILDDYDPQTPYEAARAIERYLIFDGGFTYNLAVDYDRADRAIEEFLGEGRQGFCTQFATSMALLTRELGVPSRVVYGATAGREQDQDEYLVTGRDMHTWVEVYFPGVGWYPFNPTPGFSVPPAMQANAPRPDLPFAENGAASPEDFATRQQPPEPAPETQDDPSGGSAGSAGGASVQTPYLLLLAALLFVALVAAVPLVKAALVRGGRPEDLYRDLTGRLRDVLPPGTTAASAADSPALTPTEKLLLLAGVAGVEDGTFRRFARAYSEVLYAPGGSATDVRELEITYQAALQELAGLPRWRRALGALNPASLLSRARRSLAVRWSVVSKALRRKLGR